MTPSPATLRAPAGQLSDEVGLYHRTYTTLLRSSGETLLRVLERFDAIMEIMLPSLREERAQGGEAGAHQAHLQLDHAPHGGPRVGVGHVVGLYGFDDGVEAYDRHGARAVRCGVSWSCLLDVGF